MNIVEYCRRRGKLGRLVIIACCSLMAPMHAEAAGSSSHEAAAGAKPLAFEDLLRARPINLQPTALSPDGKYVAYVTTPLDRVPAHWDIHPLSGVRSLGRPLTGTYMECAGRPAKSRGGESLTTKK